MLTPREFWRRVDADAADIVLVALLKSWKQIADHIGMEGIDIAETMFAHICGLATREATGQSRLSVSVYAAYWVESQKIRGATDSLTRWFPSEIVTPSRKVPIDVAWFLLERSSNETARELFQRAERQLNELIQELPAQDRHQPIYESWSELAAG